MQKIVKGAFRPDDLDRTLTPEIRELFLDVVLRWASVDGAVSQLFASIHGLEDISNADAIGGHPTDWKLRQIQMAARPHAPDLAKVIGKLKKQFERYSDVRNTIAHCHCAGRMKSDPERVVFLRYASAGTGGLIVDAIHMGQFQEAIRFGEHLRRTVEQLDTEIRSATSGDADQ